MNFEARMNKPKHKPIHKQRTSASFAGLALVLVAGYVKSRYGIDVPDEALLAAGAALAGFGVWARQQVQPVPVDEQGKVTPRPS